MVPAQLGWGEIRGLARRRIFAAKNARILNREICQIRENILSKIPWKRPQIRFAVAAVVAPPAFTCNHARFRSRRLVFWASNPGWSRSVAVPLPKTRARPRPTHPEPAPGLKIGFPVSSLPTSIKHSKSPIKAAFFPIIGLNFRPVSTFLFLYKKNVRLGVRSALVWAAVASTFASYGGQGATGKQHRPTVAAFAAFARN
jgi:hypothetical protein